MNGDFFERLFFVTLSHQMLIWGAPTVQTQIQSANKHEQQTRSLTRGPRKPFKMVSVPKSPQFEKTCLLSMKKKARQKEDKLDHFKALLSSRALD